MIGPVRTFFAARWGLLLKVVLVLVLQFVAWSRLRTALHAPQTPDAAPASLHAIGPLLQGLTALLVSVVIVARDLAPWLAAPLSALIDSIYLGSERNLRPPLDYRLAEFYVRHGRTDDALEEYARLIGHHPRDLRSYRDAIGYALAQGRSDLARRWFRKARWRLGDPQGLGELSHLLRNDRK